ncbi:alpha-hydroxy-acid oxidizing protein [Salinisphaera sp.]|uniref:alpha-hydroxy-acid oxidizing protein n=1 Tax=Salinisphaera sp. TaxID=1914330 RepID=UPI000C52D2FF|nr:alpha-hydroxy-acid oxidizing protein [Salinisphaera sp.]MBS63665.1 lactate 2-monooxygenase [Salinisphaera sp.]
MNQSKPATGAVARQQAIYSAGMSGSRPTVPTDYAALEAAAEKAMSEQAYAYIAGGAGRESTMAANRRAFERWRIVPRMLRDVETRDTSVELFGRRLPSPFVLCPIGVLEMAHAEADIAVARAAAARGVPMLFSNQASRSMEDCTAAMQQVQADAPRWFQLYWSKSDALVESLVARAEACGCEAIVVTLDTTLLGWRSRDLDLAHLPFLLGQGIAQYTSDPVFRASLSDVPDDGPRPKINTRTLRNVIAAARHYPGSSLRALTSGQALAAVRQFIATYSRPNITWADLAWLRQRTKLPIVLKGVLDGEDARLAVEHGVDGLIVSNHGGRQVDGARASLDALPEMVAAAPDLPVILDSGIRGGADVFKALALGARAVGIGRPYAYGLAIDGEAGVGQVLDNLAADFELTMALSGCRDIDAIRAGATRLVRDDHAAD